MIFILPRAFLTLCLSCGRRIGRYRTMMHKAGRVRTIICKSIRLCNFRCIFVSKV